jgi:DNA-binding NarL/FixJ family response regulator
MSLTPRRHAVASLVAEGLHNREIAQRLDISPCTVRMHLVTIFRQLHVRNRVELAICMIHSKLGKQHV